jgi:hypothetical protein
MTSYLVIDAGTPEAAFTVRNEMKAYPKRRLEMFTNPLIYTFGDNERPAIITMSRASAGSTESLRNRRGYSKAAVVNTHDRLVCGESHARGGGV